MKNVRQDLLHHTSYAAGVSRLDVAEPAMLDALWKALDDLD